MAMSVRLFGPRRRFLSALILVIGLLAPVLILTYAGGKSLTKGEAAQDEGGVRAGPVVLPGQSIIANGTQVTIAEAEAQAPFDVYRPQHALASDSSLTAVWLASDPPQVGLQYDSGIRVYVHPSEFGDPLTFYLGQIANGTNGSIETIDGNLAFIVSQNKAEGTPGNVDMVIQGLEVTIIGDGDFSNIDLRAVADTILGG